MASSLLQRLALRGVFPPSSASQGGPRPTSQLAIQNAPSAPRTQAAVKPAVVKADIVPRAADPARTASQWQHEQQAVASRKTLEEQQAVASGRDLTSSLKGAQSSHPSEAEVQLKVAAHPAGKKVRGRPPKGKATVPVSAADMQDFNELFAPHDSQETGIGQNLGIQGGEPAMAMKRKGPRPSPIGKLNRKSLLTSSYGKALLLQSPLAKRKRKQRDLTPPPQVEEQTLGSPPQKLSSKRPRKGAGGQEKAPDSGPAGQSRLLPTPQRRQSSAEDWASPSLPQPLSTPPRQSKEGKAECANSPNGKALSFNTMPEQCGLCCEDMEASQAIRLRCEHGWYCMQCMSRHVEARLDTGAVQQTCPECNVELAERDLKRLIPPQLMDRLLARSLEAAVASTADIRPCPTPNCPMRVALEADESGQFVCTECKKGCCLRCGAQPYHKKLTCEQHAAKTKTKRCSFLQWMEKTGAKQCPSCQMAVTKQDLKKQGTQASECHKMLCRNCGTKFCFKCLAVLTAEYSCGCTKDQHGFVDPHTGKYVGHLNKKPVQAPKSGGHNAGHHNGRESKGGA